MTKKDYTKLAVALREAREDMRRIMMDRLPTIQVEISMVYVDRIMTVLKRDNPNFKPDVFLAAVYGEEEKSNG